MASPPWGPSPGSLSPLHLSPLYLSPLELSPLDLGPLYLSPERCRLTEQYFFKDGYNFHQKKQHKHGDYTRYRLRARDGELKAHIYNVHRG